jgi:hypothetical protein
MRNFGPLFFVLLLALAVVLLACGSSHRLLQSVSISPLMADANGSAVQFTASGFYSTPPSPITPLAANWGACDLNGSVTNAVWLSTTGLAHCAAGSVGTYTVWAWAPSGETVCPDVVTACGEGGCQVTGIAELTCP